MRQQGMAIVGALFLIVALAALAAYTMRLDSQAARGHALELLDDRAELAALAGLEWGAYRVLRQSQPCPYALNLPALPGTLRTFSVRVECTPLSGSWRLSATARHGTDPTQPDYVERRLVQEVAP